MSLIVIVFHLLGSVGGHAHPPDSFLQITQALVAYAYRHDLPVNADLIVALDESTNDSKGARPLLPNSVLAEKTRDLITQLDETLGEGDAEFRRLFRSFRAEEENLAGRARR